MSYEYKYKIEDFYLDRGLVANSNDLKDYLGSLPITLNPHQKDLVVGSALGDLSIVRLGKEGRAQFKQSIKNKPYVDHMYKIIKGYVGKHPIPKLVKLKGYETVHEQLYFHTYAHPIFSHYHRWFYRKGESGGCVKIVPQDIEDHLTPRAVAYWFMDDGSNHRPYRGGYYIHTESFSRDCIDLLVRVLRDRYNLDVKPQAVKGKHRLYISVSSINTMRELILPYMHPSMMYKVGEEAHPS